MGHEQREPTVNKTTILVIGSVTAAQYETLRRDAFRKKLSARIQRISVQQFYDYEEAVWDANDGKDWEKYEAPEDVKSFFDGLGNVFAVVLDASFWQNYSSVGWSEDKYQLFYLLVKDRAPLEVWILNPRGRLELAS
jgi:hypothetical protein